MKSQSILNSQHNKECGSRFIVWLHAFFWSLVEYFTSSAVSVNVIANSSVRSSLSAKGLRTILEVVQIVRAGVISRVGVYILTRKVNARLLAGIFLAVCMAPLVDIFYMFDYFQQFESWNIKTDTEWYYDNYSYLFISIGPYLNTVFTLTGAYLVFIPAGTKRSWSWLIAVVITYPVAKTLWLIQVESHAEYHEFPSLFFMVYGFILSFILWFLSDYFAWRKYHRADAHERRMDGLCQIADMKDPVQKAFVETWRELKAKNY
jgi:hypothetical protein